MGYNPKLQFLLGYDEWRNFTHVLTKAKTACEVSGFPALDHFVDVNKMVELGSGRDGKLGRKPFPLTPLHPVGIGAFAMRYEGLITRNPSDFADIFPSLAIRVP